MRTLLSLFMIFLSVGSGLAEMTKEEYLAAQAKQYQEVVEAQRQADQVASREHLLRMGGYLCVVILLLAIAAIPFVRYAKRTLQVSELQLKALEEIRDKLKKE